MKRHKHIGAYGVILENNKILLIKKNGGPYDGKLDLPGGTIEYKERPEETLIRELKEEVGIDVTDFELLNVDSVNVTWNYNDEEELVHHIAIFYKILNYEKEILNEVKITEINDDSMGAEFYNIKELNINDISNITSLILDKLGYKIT